MTVTLDPVPLDLLVDIVNGWGTAPRAEAGEQHEPYPSGHDLLRRSGLDGVTSATEARLVAVADRLFPVFAPGAGQRRIRIVDRALAECRVRPSVAASDEGVRAAWAVASRDDALLAASALALHDHLARYGLARLGVCGGRHCVDVYVDASPAGRRHYCSLTCQNRARVASFRSRRKVR